MQEAFLRWQERINFYKDLEFGTGGMRGIMGVGPNRVNKYTFGKNTQAIADIINLKKNPINCINRRGIEIEGIGMINLDMIILATGFDAMTGALNNINIIGKNNITLKDKWINGPETYLGLAMNGFPNFFTITGPGSPSVLTNMIPTIEQHVDWIADCIRYIKKKSYHSIEANLDAEIEWGKYNDKCANDTLRYYCDSWYLGSNVTGKKRVFYPFVGGLPVYIEKCEEIVNNSYEGFTLE